MNKIFIGLIYLSILINSEKVYSSDKYHVIYQDSEIILLIDSLNTSNIDSSVFAYKAKNQPLQLNFKVVNKKLPKEIKFNVCTSKPCLFEKQDFDRKYLVSWYKDSNATKSALPGKKGAILVPELLLNDPQLIVANKNISDNQIRTKIGGETTYITSKQYEKITNLNKQGRQAHSADKHEVNDALKFMPVMLEDEIEIFTKQNDINLNKKIFVNIEYNGNSRLIELPVKIFNFNINGKLINSIYYRSIITKEKPTLSSEFKTISQMKLELNDMLEKGIDYPTMYIYNKDFSNLDARNNMGFKKDLLFIIDSVLINHAKKNEWYKYEIRMKDVLNNKLVSQYEKVYFYLIDEPEESLYVNMIQMAHPIAQNLKAGLFLAGRKDKILNVIMQDVIYVIAYNPIKELAAKVHERGGLILSYANPQIGVYKPKEMRFNYGFQILNNNYDGIMPYAYQDSRGTQWSDFDGKYRDHMLTYPTSSGLIQTIHGFALENAIYDQKFIETWKYWKTNIKQNCGVSLDDNFILNSVTEFTLDKARYSLAQGIENMIAHRNKCVK